MLQRKLRLPLSPTLPPLCSCGKPLDPFGDHFFTCRKHPKSTLSNKIRDTLHTVLHTLGALAGFCRNNTDIQCEPAAILPHHPTKRPADIGFSPLSPASPSDPSITSRYIALDVTIPAPPASALALLPTQLPSPHPLLAAHNKSARQKFCGRTSQVDAALLVADLNANNITLVPCTFDHLGGLGFFLHRLLFGPTSHLSYTLPPKPPWTSPNDFPHSPAFFAFQRSFHAPHSLLPHASRQWRVQTKKNPHRFGPSRSTTSPSQWAIQCLALNTSLALSAHLSSAIQTTTPAHPPPPPLPGPAYTSPYTTYPHT